jgi:hypothetical protein
MRTSRFREGFRDRRTARAAETARNRRNAVQAAQRPTVAPRLPQVVRIDESNNNKFRVTRALDRARQNPALRLYQKPSKQTLVDPRSAEQPNERSIGIPSVVRRDRRPQGDIKSSSLTVQTERKLCKPRPTDSRRKGGRSRAFIPWCKK